jgi:type VI protein secretion system component Hcp
MYKRVKLYYVVAAVPIILAASAQAQPLNLITMNSTGFNCTTPAGGQTFAVKSYRLNTQNSTKAQESTPESAHPSPPGTVSGPLRVNKVVDTCSPVLVRLVLEGNHVQRVMLVDNLTNIELVLSDVVFISDELLGSGDSGLPQESIGMTFGKIEWHYTAQNTVVCWDNLAKISRCVAGGL